MRIVSWNVNSIRARLDQLTSWLARADPDVICMQETKVEDGIFPHGELGESGYKVACYGQKTYNGVAIAARFGLAIEDVKNGFDGDGDDAERRLIAATIEGIRVVCAYVPNGQEIGSPAFAKKLAFFEKLRAELDAHAKPDGEVFVCGDFNVAPEPIDVYDPKKCAGNILFHPDEREGLKRVMGFGLVDLVRHKHPDEKGLYSWWDYRMGAYKRNKGLRIDHALGTPKLAARVTEAGVDKRPRDLPKPSDHAPVVVDLT